MRISTRRPRRRKPSRFERGGGSAQSRDLIRFRRNRESLVREVTVLLLWAALVFLLARLTGSLWTVSQRHLAEQPAFLRASLPALALFGIGFAIWRSRGTWSEIVDIRREQADLSRRLREAQGRDEELG
jgi:hypothetical protein